MISEAVARSSDSQWGQGTRAESVTQKDARFEKLFLLHLFPTQARKEGQVRLLDWKRWNIQNTEKKNQYRRHIE